MTHPNAGSNTRESVLTGCVTTEPGCAVTDLQMVCHRLHATSVTEILSERPGTNFREIKSNPFNQEVKLFTDRSFETFSI